MRLLDLITEAEDTKDNEKEPSAPVDKTKPNFQQGVEKGIQGLKKADAETPKPGKANLPNLLRRRGAGTDVTKPVSPDLDKISNIKSKQVAADKAQQLSKDQQADLDALRKDKQPVKIKKSINKHKQSASAPQAAPAAGKDNDMSLAALAKAAMPEPEPEKIQWPPKKQNDAPIDWTPPKDDTQKPSEEEPDFSDFKNPASPSLKNIPKNIGTALKQKVSKVADKTGVPRIS